MGSQQVLNSVNFFQNRFRDIGINNLTLFVESKLKNPKSHIGDVKLVFINVELSNEHLSSKSPFIHGNTENLTGNLTVFRLYSLYSTRQRHSGFLNLSATAGISPSHHLVKFTSG